MKKKSQVLFYTLMLSTLIIVLTLALINPLKYFTNTAKSDMNCTDSSISDYDKATCYGWDINFFFWILLCIGIAFVVLGGKVVGG